VRLSPAGTPGVFAFDACNEVQHKGVYTSNPEFPHLCRPCFNAAIQTIP